MKSIITPHDRYFRAAMSEPRVARDFFEAYLPQDIRKRVDLESLQICKESHIDEKLQLQITDLLFSVNFSEDQGYFYLLTEHQSKADYFMPLRLWKYILAIMEQHCAKSKEKILPIVYPIVYYNGRISYGYSTDFFDLFGKQKDFAKSILLQAFQLIDLTKIRDEELRNQTWAGIMGFVMKHIFVRDILPHVKEIMPSLKHIEKMNADRYIEITFSYLLQTGKISDKKTIIDTFAKELSHLGEKLMTSADVLREEGMAQGMTQGIKQKGRDVAIKLLQANMSLSQIAQITELPLNEIRALAQEINVTS